MSVFEEIFDSFLYRLSPSAPKSVCYSGKHPKFECFPKHSHISLFVGLTSGVFAGVENTGCGGKEFLLILRLIHNFQYLAIEVH